jgi:hypothetical protein
MDSHSPRLVDARLDMGGEISIPHDAACATKFARDAFFVSPPEGASANADDRYTSRRASGVDGAR